MLFGRPELELESRLREKGPRHASPKPRRRPQVVEKGGFDSANAWMTGRNYAFTIAGNHCLSSTFSHTGIPLSGKKRSAGALRPPLQGTFAHKGRDVEVLSRFLNKGWVRSGVLRQNGWVGHRHPYHFRLLFRTGQFLRHIRFGAHRLRFVHPKRGDK